MVLLTRRGLPDRFLDETDRFDELPFHLFDLEHAPLDVLELFFLMLTPDLGPVLHLRNLPARQRHRQLNLLNLVVHRLDLLINSLKRFAMTFDELCCFLTRTNLLVQLFNLQLLPLHGLLQLVF